LTNTDSGKQPLSGKFMPISAMTIIPGTTGQFDLYLSRKGSYVLYSQKGDRFGEEKLAGVLEVTEFFVPVDQRFEYERYMAQNLGELLDNEDVPFEERSRLFHNISSSVVQRTLDTKVPATLSPELYQEIKQIVAASIRFIDNPKALKSFSRFISHDYHTYSHSLQVMVLLLSLMRGLPKITISLLTECGVGALLHDIGKTVIPVDVLNKTGPLSTRDWEMVKTHPAKGLRMCSEMPLTQAAVNCILFHHERVDGTGYPGGLTGEAIPREAKAMAVCDVYDALTTDRPYAKGMQPFAALTHMKENMPGHFDAGMYKGLVQVLSSADLV